MSIARHALMIPALLFAGCVTQEVKPERIEKKTLAEHETKLVKQFEGGSVIACRTLEIEANGFLFNRNLVLPAGEPSRERNELFETMTWSITDEVQTRRQQSSGARPGWDVKPRSTTRKRNPHRDKFRIMIGSTAFLVDERITVRRLLKAPPTLTARAKGHVMVIRDGKGSSFQEVTFTDGRVEAR